jgi:hypothetical protein
MIQSMNIVPAGISGTTSPLIRRFTQSSPAADFKAPVAPQSHPFPNGRLPGSNAPDGVTNRRFECFAGLIRRKTLLIRRAIRDVRESRAVIDKSPDRMNGLEAQRQQAYCRTIVALRRSVLTVAI